MSPNAFPELRHGPYAHFDEGCERLKSGKRILQRRLQAGGWEQVLSYLTKLSSCAAATTSTERKAERIRKAAAMGSDQIRRLYSRVRNQTVQRGRTAAQKVIWKYLDYHREYGYD